jgi:hypothetical protein
LAAAQIAEKVESGPGKLKHLLLSKKLFQNMTAAIKKRGARDLFVEHRKSSPGTQKPSPGTQKPSPGTQKPNPGTKDAADTLAVVGGRSCADGRSHAEVAAEGTGAGITPPIRGVQAVVSPTTAQCGEGFQGTTDVWEGKKSLRQSLEGTDDECTRGAEDALVPNSEEIGTLLGRCSAPREPNFDGCEFGKKDGKGSSVRCAPRT